MVRDYVRTLSRVEFVAIGLAADSSTTFIQNVSIDYCRPTVTAVKEFLQGVDVVIGCDQMGGEGLQLRASGQPFRDNALLLSGAICPADTSVLTLLVLPRNLAS